MPRRRQRAFSEDVRAELKRAVALAVKPKFNFIELSVCCFNLLNSEPHALSVLISGGHVSKRTAYNYAEVGKAIECMKASGDYTKVTIERLYVMGWTKLGVISPVVDSDNWLDWLEKAEEHNVPNLKRAVSGQAPVPDPKAINLSLSAKDYEKVADALVRLGAYRSNGRIKYKEEALVAMVKSLGDE